VHVLQGEREMAAGNKSLGKFDLTDIPAAPRGMPQIEVTFDIDANGILHVSAKDKATGKEQKIVIKASSGLSDDEVQRMVRDAEAHAEEDHKAAQLVHARNQADNLVHQVRKTVADLGDKLGEDEKTRVEEAIKATEDAARGDDKDAIEAATAALSAASASLAEKAYAGDQTPGAGGGEPGKRSGDDVVDAEFKEVRDGN
jgi:molecular chaperone DnaK